MDFLDEGDEEEKIEDMALKIGRGCKKLIQSLDSLEVIVGLLKDNSLISVGQEAKQERVLVHRIQMENFVYHGYCLDVQGWDINDLVLRDGINNRRNKKLYDKILRKISQSLV